MPPRFAYWTILIDNRPTAFRAQFREELLPTLHQLQRKNADVAMKWFARGRVWESVEEERAARIAPKPRLEHRDHLWRPGGEHKDPRARWAKGSGGSAAHRRTDPDARFKKSAPSESNRSPAGWKNKQSRPASPHSSRKAVSQGPAAKRRPKPFAPPHHQTPQDPTASDPLATPLKPPQRRASSAVDK